MLERHVLFHRCQDLATDVRLREFCSILLVIIHLYDVSHDLDVAKLLQELECRINDMLLLVLTALQSFFFALAWLLEV